MHHRQWAWRDRGGTLIHCSLLITLELQKCELVLIMMTRLPSAQTACVRCINASLRLPKSQFNWNKYWLAHMQTHKPILLYFPYTLNKHNDPCIHTHSHKKKISVCTSHMCLQLHVSARTHPEPYRLPIYCSCFILQLIAAVCEPLRDSHVYLGVDDFWVCLDKYSNVSHYSSLNLNWSCFHCCEQIKRGLVKLCVGSSLSQSTW